MTTQSLEWTNAVPRSDQELTPEKRRTAEFVLQEDPGMTRG